MQSLLKEIPRIASAGFPLLRKVTNSVHEGQFRLIMEPGQKRTGGSVELICDITNVSMSISLDCSGNVHNQLFYHNFAHLTQAAADIFVTVGFDTHVPPYAAGILRWISTSFHPSSVQNFITVRQSVLNAVASTLSMGILF
ncbi:hypothetical protein TNCV_1731071 [Trichonephila clavipes]|nr:hypothetical protein TNCV_1731071 [Trichonephila clavipes]